MQLKYLNSLAFLSLSGLLVAAGSAPNRDSAGHLPGLLTPVEDNEESSDLEWDKDPHQHQASPLTIGDPDVVGQWWHRKLELNAVWSFGSGKGTMIADCDAGYYIDEQELQSNLLTKIRQDLADQDAPRAVNDGSYPSHGTAVASLMVAALDGQGTNGIAFNAKLVPLQNYNYDSSLDDLDIIEATTRCIMTAATNPEIDILVVQTQLPEGSLESDRELRNAMRLATLAGLLVIIPAGNSAREIDEPQVATGALVVGAINRQGDRSIFSNYGPGVDLATYGENLKTIFGPDGRSGVFGGTAAAAAIVAATAAIIYEVNPQLTPGEVKRILKLTSDQTSGTADMGGALNILKAIRVAKERNPN